MIGNNLKNNFDKRVQNGFTLVEMMVAVALFVIVITAAVQIFLRTAKSQDASTSSKNVQESVNFAMSKMATTLKGAQSSMANCDSDCDIPGNYYCLNGEELIFKDARNTCVRYKLEEDGNSIPHVLMNYHDSSHFLTPASVRVTDLKFSISGTAHPALTIYLKAQSQAEDGITKSADAQTTIVSPSDEYGN